MKFSIIIPLYNKAHTIIQTIKSVLSQSFVDYEVLIIDDGSTDGSVSVIDNFTSDSRIRIIRQQNQGVSVARNVGIQEAKGDYIAFLDGDDEWSPEYLQKASEVISNNHEVGLILSGRVDQDNIKSIKREIVSKKHRKKTCQIDYFESPNIFSHISSTVIKRDLLINNWKTWGKFEPGHSYNEDYTFVYRVAMHTKVIYIGFPLLIYNGGVTGQTTSTMTDNIRLRDSVLFHNFVIAEWLSISKRPKTFKIFIKYEIRHIILGFIKNNKYDKITRFCNSLDRNYSKFFPAFEWNQYCRGNISNWMRYYIYLTKIRWRMRGFPRV